MDAIQVNGIVSWQMDRHVTKSNNAATEDKIVQWAKLYIEEIE